MTAVTDAKTCTKCLTDKASDEFHKNARARDGLHSWCKPCMAAYHRVHQQKPAVRARRNETGLALYHAQTPEGKRAWNNNESRHLKAKYRMSLDDYEAMLAAQNGRCAICAAEPGEKRLAVDHDHKCCPVRSNTCGKCVRGLLCTTCNIRLGFYENEQWADAARRYLDANA